MATKDFRHRESKKPKKPKLCAGCGNMAGIPWKEG